MEEVLEFLDDFGNILAIGRRGIFNYYGMTDAMDMGFTAAQYVISTGPAVEWNVRRQKFDNYVTVD